MKSIVKSIVIYLCVIGITLLAAIVTGGEFVVFLLGFELVLPVFLFILLYYFSKKIEIKIKTPTTTIKNEKFNCELFLINSAEFPISCIEITIICQDVFDNTIIREVVSGVIDRKSISTIKLGMEAGYAGKVNFRIEEAKLYDYFHLFARSISCDTSWNQTIIVPNIYDISFQKEFDSVKMLENKENHFPDKKGDDISEVYNIRPFMAGDALHKIHWKLSVKTDELLIKEFSDPLGKAINIFIDYSQKEEEDWTHERFDDVATRLLSISNQLLLEEEVHQIFWYDASEKMPHQMIIEKNEDIYETIGELTSMKPYKDIIDFESMINENSEYEHQTKAYILNIWDRMEISNEEAAK